MGIHGLTSFIDNNSHLLKDRRLHDCRVVIDGNNFYHFLYFYCNIRFQFGGDFDIFQRKICMIFSMFKSCNIEVFVVFDGAYTVDGKKFKTTLSRAKDRVYASQRIMNGQRGVLIPCLAQHTFKQTLDKLGIPHVTCDFEADNQLVILANQWNCPVISNDSDFYIFDLSGGFIPLDYIDFRPQQIPKESSQDGTAGSFLPVQYYHVDEFIKSFKSLNRSVLPLFATMLGNDYVNAAAFEAFYQKTPKIATRRCSGCKKHQKIMSVLHWLEEKQHEGELVSEVLSFIRPERRQQVQKLLNSSISGYLDTQDFESFDIKAFLEGDQTAAMHHTDAVISSTGECLPAWFVAACRSGKMPVFLLNAVLLHCVILPTQVESISLPAAFTVSRAVRGVIYGVLLGAQGSPHRTDSRCQDSSQLTASEQTSAKILPENGKSIRDNQLETTNKSESGNVSDEADLDTEKSEPDLDMAEHGKEASEPCVDASSAAQPEKGILEYTRHNLELRRVIVPACVSLAGFGSLPSLEEVPAVGLDKRQAILTGALGVTSTFVSKVDPSLQLYMMCLAFWARNADPHVSHHQLKGILLSAVLLHVHREIADRENQIIEASVSESAKEGYEADAAHLGNGMKTQSLCGTVQRLVPPHEHPGQHHSAKSKTAQNTETNEGSSLSIAGTCHLQNDKVLTKVRDNLKKYYHDPVKISKKNPPVREIFHADAQFLACLLDVIHLNSLLCCPFPIPQLPDLFNGSFIYTMVHELQLRSNPDLFLSEMLVKGSSLIALFDAMCSAVMQEAGEVFAEEQAPGKKRCKGAKKRKKQQTAMQGKKMAEGEVWSMEDQTGHAEMANCDLTNRFGALLLDDDS